MKLLVFGRSGQLARSLVALGRTDPGLVVEAAGRSECDIRDLGAVQRAVEAAKPDAVVNAAAYTAVDKAETEEREAYEINAIGAGNIARAADGANLPLVHISTDYVFDGAMARPYLEDDLPFPLGAYGRTKLAGEYAVRHHAGDAAVLRTAWVFSPYGGNFARTMLRLAAERDRLGVVDDQVGNPTYAPEIAKACVVVARALCERGKALPRGGVFNFSGPEEMSWRAFASRIMAIAAAHGMKTAQVDPIPTSAYPTPAVRPKNSRLDNSRIRQEFGIGHLPVDDCLADMLAVSGDGQARA